MVTSEESPEFNDLIFKELIKRGYTLEGNTRVWNIADSKLWYLTPDQADAYLEAVEKAPDYKKAMIDSEIELLEENIEDIASQISNGDNVTIMDIGCGDGKKAIVPIEYLKKKGKKITYCPIDISGFMVEKAKENISKLDIDQLIDFKWNISDFENLENVTPLLRRKDNGILMLFLGSTLGNFEMHEVLYEIRESMSFEDSLLIGVSIGDSSEEDYAKAYKTEYADYFLGKVLKQIGFKDDEMEFDSRYKHRRVECFYKITKDKEITFQDRKINFHKGDQIIVSVSNKYNEKSFEDALKLYFGKCKVYLNDKKSWALILCKK